MVIKISNTDATMVLDGFTIRGGNGWLTFDFSDIGSLYLKNYDANIRYLKIHDNHYDGFAETGGILLTNTSSPYFKDILLFDNSSYLGTYWVRAGDPGRFDPVTPTFENVTFSNTSEPGIHHKMSISGNETLVKMTNCITWNGDRAYDSDIGFDSTKLDISFSNI